MKTIKSSLNSNYYWLSLISYLQDPSIPKDLSCISQLESFYGQISLEDLKYVTDEYIHLDNIVVSIAIADDQVDNNTSS